MPNSYIVQPVTGTELATSFPLLHGVASGLNAERWQRFCKGEDEAAKDHIVLVALDGNGYVRGVAGYILVHHRTWGASLQSPIFVVASLIDPDGVAEALITELAARAWQSHASNLVVGLDGLEDRAKEALRRRGAIFEGRTARLGLHHLPRH